MLKYSLSLYFFRLQTNFTTMNNYQQQFEIENILLLKDTRNPEVLGKGTIRNLNSETVLCVNQSEINQQYINNFWKFQRFVVL